MYSKAKVVENPSLYSIHCCGQSLLMDCEDEPLFQKPPNVKNKRDIWKIEENTNNLYTHNTNGKIMYLYQLLSNRYLVGDYVVFKDCNPFNLSKNNFEIKNSFLEECEKSLMTLIKFTSFELVHYYASPTGINANIIKNPVWKIRIDEPKSKTYLMMYCNDGEFIKFNVEELEELKKTVFLYTFTNGKIRKERRRIKKKVTKKECCESIESREESIKTLEKYLIDKKYNIITSIPGNVNQRGEYRNHRWKVITSNGDECIAVHIKNIKNPIFTLIDTDLEEIDLYDGISNPIWFMTNVGYVACKLPHTNNVK